MASTSEKDRKFFDGDSRLFLYYVKGVEGYKLSYEDDHDRQNCFVLFIAGKCQKISVSLIAKRNILRKTERSADKT